MAQPNELAYLLSSELDHRERLLALNYEYDTLPPSIFTATETMDVPAVPVAGGRYGDVYLVKRNDSYLAFKVLRAFNQETSAKKVRQTKLPVSITLADLSKMFGREALMLASMNHPSILPFLGLDSSVFAPNIAIVTPWCPNGTAVQFLSHPRNYPMRIPIVSSTLKFAYAHRPNTFQIAQIAEGLAYLHSRDVIHGDIRGVSPSLPF